MLKCNKGISLVEILVTVGLIGLATPIVATIFMYGLQDYVTGTRYLEQQTNLNTTYITFRRQYEMAREVTLVNDSTTSSPIKVLAIELKYSPTSGVIDYDEDYRKLHEIDSNNEGRTNPPFDQSFVDKLQRDEAFHTRWEFVQVQKNSRRHPYFDEIPNASDRPEVYDLYAMSVADIDIIGEDSISDMDENDRPEPLIRGIYGSDDRGDIKLESGIFYWGARKKLWLRIIPVPVNRGPFGSRNIIRPIEWHFDYVYKEFEYRDTSNDT